MKNITIGTILKKTAKKENELYLLYKNAGRRVKDDRIRTILKRFTREELNHVEIFNILYMFKLKNEK
jgi:rubrerythrin